MPMIAPTDVAELADAIAGAAANSGRLELRGDRSKAATGAPEREAAVVDLRGFASVVDYDPVELVLTVRA